MNEHEYAGFWIRFGATLIDLLFWLIIIIVPLSFIYGEEYWVGDKFYYGIWDGVFSYILPFVLTIWFWLKYFGTPGKIIIKLKIVDEKTGGKLSVGQAIGRYFAYIPATLPFFLGFIWVGFDKKKQGWHDKLAGTVVIRSK